MPTDTILGGTYVVRNKSHLRASILEEEALDAHGNRFVHRTQGPTGRLEVGALVSDLTPAELAAFPDRFRVATDADFAAEHARQDAARAALEAVPLAQDAAQLAQQQAALQQQITALQQQVQQLETQRNAAEGQAARQTQETRAALEHLQAHLAAQQDQPATTPESLHATEQQIADLQAQLVAANAQAQEEAETAQAERARRRR